jgi:hypothetical protein
MTKLTETQTIILSAGAQRPENMALPLRKGLAGAAAKMAVTKMIERGWLQKVDANLRRNEPLWRETGAKLARNRRWAWHDAGGHQSRSVDYRDRTGDSQSHVTHPGQR